MPNCNKKKKIYSKESCKGKDLAEESHRQSIFKKASRSSNFSIELITTKVELLRKIKKTKKILNSYYSI